MPSYPKDFSGLADPRNPAGVYLQIIAQRGDFSLDYSLPHDEDHVLIHPFNAIYFGKPTRVQMDMGFEL
ncbi:hypothetical protein ACFL0V_04475, partial [Nanoarchaeota archaeon]